MPSLRRNRRARVQKHKPEVVTGNFELHYEDVLHRNRFVMIALFASSLLLLAAFIPSAVDQSIADIDQYSLEAEAGKVLDTELVNVVTGDDTASDNSYIEFRVRPLNVP